MSKIKRDIIRFDGSLPTTINLEHVTSINIEKNRITFCFYTTSIFVDLDSEEAAKKSYEEILKTWAEGSQE